MREMKDSAIAWCGEIPSNWDVMPNKYIMYKKKEICPVYTGEDILSLTMDGVIIRDLDAGGKMPATFNGYQIVYPNNLLMCLFDYDVTPRCIGLIKDKGLTSPAYSQFVMKNNNNSKYYYYYYLMIDNTKELLHLAKNLRHSFTEDQLGIINVPVPPIEEQLQIAYFLDVKCTEIDELYSDIEKQIKALEEYKKSIITEIVTKGLNSDVEMNDSGVEWIEKIPKTWIVSKLKLNFHFGKGLSITKENLIDEGVSVISYGQLHSKSNSETSISNDLIRFVDKRYLQTHKSSLVKKYDFIIADTSEDLSGCGNFVCVDRDIELFAGYHTIVLKSLCPRNSRYLAYLFKTDSWRTQIRSRVSGVKLFSITQKILKEASIILPSEKEQNKIVTFLDEKCKLLDEIIAGKKNQLEILEEYKKSMIYEYVTGKKEVTV